MPYHEMTDEIFARHRARAAVSVTVFLGLMALATIAGAQEAEDNGDQEPGAEEEIFTLPPEGEEKGEKEQGDGGQEEDGQVDPVDVEVVEVEARPIENVGGAAHQLDERELERQEYDNPNDILREVPGLYIRPEDGFGLRPNIGMRGANSERSKKVTLMEDGILFGPAPYSAPAAYYFPVVNRMVGVDVFKGPAAVQYGPQTIGGAVNWRTREIPDQLTGGFDLNGGSYFTGKAHGYFGAGADWGGLLIEGIHWQSDGFKELDGGGDTGFNRQEFMAKGMLNTDRSQDAVHEVQLKVGYSREHSDETYLGLTDEDFEEQPLRRYRASALDEMDWDRTQAELRYRFEYDTSVDIEVTAYRHDFQRTWFKFNGFKDPTPIEQVLENPDSGRRAVLHDVLTGRQDSTGDNEALLLGTNAREYVSQGVQAVAQHLVYGDDWFNHLEVGVRLHDDRVDRDHTEDEYRMASGELVESDTPTRTTTQNRGESLALAVHVLDKVSLFDLTLTPGLRAEFIGTEFTDFQRDESSENMQTVLIPGVGAHYAITPEFGALAGVHRGFSPVSPGQPDEVEAETSVNYEAGVRYRDERTGTHLEAIGFFNDYGNLIGECSFSAGCDRENLNRQFNAGEVSIYGAEFTAAHTFAVTGEWFVPLRLVYTLTQSRFRTSFTSDNPQFGEVESGDELPYVPRHQGSAHVGLTNQSFAFNARVGYIGEMREEAGQGEETRMTDRQVLLDMLVSYEVFDGLDVYGKASNLLGQSAIASRRPFGARPASPFMARLGVKYKY